MVIVPLTVTGAVGPTLLLDVCVEGVEVAAVVDTGAQSTIISRSLLHKIKKHLSNQGKSLPSLEFPLPFLYGKGGNRLHITARVNLTIAADGSSVNVPVSNLTVHKSACWE